MSHTRFFRLIVLSAAVVALMLMVPTSAAAGGRVGVGFYGGYYGYGFGPYYPYYPYAFGPYGYPYGYGYYGGRPLGEVHIKSPDTNAEIFINGAFAGRAHDLKRFYLAPGTYNVEQHIGSDVQKQHIYVLANRSLKLEFGKPGTTPSASPAPAGQSAPPPAPSNAPAPNPSPTPQAAPESAPDGQV